MIRTCPDEEVLSAIAAGETDDLEAVAHAAQCPDCKAALTRMQMGLATMANLWAAQHTVEQSPAAARPLEVGKYLIVGTLGEGAQAVVYRGLHPALGREVVLKVGKHAAKADDASRAGLVNEGKVLSLLHHPGLARVLDLDWHEGRPYLVMDHIAGIDLEQYAARRKPSPAESAALVAQVARALESAHAAGVVHHDIKPRNILVRDEDGQPVLIDFGLAWLRRASGEPDAAPGGTLPYMAPEQARGDVDRVGPASDVFGLGAVLFHLLTGSAPISGTDAFTVHQKAMRGEIDANLLDSSSAPAALKRLCLRALSPDPRDRPPSAGAFARELEAAGRPSRRWAVAAGVASIAAAVAAVVFWPRGAGPLPLALGAQPMLKLFQTTKDGKPEKHNPPLLAAALANGDLAEVQFETPRGSHAELWWLDAAGKLNRCQTVAAGEGVSGPKLRYPTKGHAVIGGKPGTEIVLAVCSRAGRELPTEAQVRDALGSAWPALDAQDPPLLLHPGGVEEGADSRGPEATAETPLTKVRGRLEALRETLKTRCDWAWAVAVPHR